MVFAIPGQISNLSYAVSGQVLEKYAPKLEARSFFVRLAGVSQPVWFALCHFSKFEPLDVIGVTDYREGRQGFWVGAGDTVSLVTKAEVPVHGATLKLGYVSNPRSIEGEYWYMFKLAKWHRCHYSVAGRYWLGDEGAKDDLSVDYFTLLGVDKDASFQEIRAAWRCKIVACHPDRHLDCIDYYTRLAARVNAARDCLTDVGERERYERQLQATVSADLGEVRAWPGRGFGTLKAKVEDRGTVILVKEILSWEPERLEFQGVLSFDMAASRGEEIRVLVPVCGGLMQVGQEVYMVPKSLLPSDVVRGIEHRCKGQFKCRLSGIRTGGYSVNRGVYSWIRVQEVEILGG